MGELSIEQKAHRYDKAIEKIQKYAKDNYGCTRLRPEDIFPELEDREGEIIRKSIICGMNALKKQNKETFASIPIDDCIAWLEEQGKSVSLPKWKYKSDNTPLLRDSLILNKYGCVAKSPSGALVSDVWVIDYDELIKLPKEAEKQGEQKPYGQREECENCQFNYAGECKGYCQMKRDEQKSTDKVEPKFKVGDWVIQNEWKNVVKVVNAAPLIYEVVDVLGYHNTITNTAMENNYHLWTIQDAKDGDVLATKKGNPFIYDKNRYNNGLAYSYAGLNVNKELTLKSPHHMLAHFGELRSVSPATKEQRDTLMKAMADAGYTFDFERKELKKIEEPENFKNQVMSEITDLVEDYITQKPAEWSEEDDINLEKVIWYVEKGGKLIFMKTDKLVSWLKSLRPQNNWKPTKEQIEALAYHIDHNIIDKGGVFGSKLVELLGQLKNLYGVQDTDL